MELGYFMKKSKKRNFDSPWKEALTIFFQDFLKFCFSEAAEEIDWQKGYVFLDKELQAITQDTATGMRTVDKLVKVFKTGGEEVWVLVHIEVQGQKDKAFSERMYIYYYRLFDRYRVPVVSVALLIDSDENWVPKDYCISLWGTEVQFKYMLLKLLSYRSQKEALENSRNPFAVVILAQLEALALTKKNQAEANLASKLKLTRLLYEKGWGREAICHLFRFIDWLIQLPEDLVINYEEEIERLEGEKKVAYVTSIERLGVQRGMQQGMQQGEEKGIARVVQNLYESVKDEKQVAKLAKLSLKKVREILNGK